MRNTPLSNTNQLLSGGTNAYTGAYGVKTGTTDRARENLVSAAKNTGPGGKDVIAVVLGSDDDAATAANRYTDSSTLLDWALDRPWGDHGRATGTRQRPSSKGGGAA